MARQRGRANKSVARSGGTNRTHVEGVVREVHNAFVVQRLLKNLAHDVHHERTLKAAERQAHDDERRAAKAARRAICWDCGDQGVGVGPEGCIDKLACAKRARSWR